MNTSVVGYCLHLLVQALPIYTANIMEADRERLSSDVPWTVSDRGRMTRALEQVLAGGTELAGLPPVVLPAEFVAAAIALCVHPVNHLVACAWCGEKLSLQTEANGAVDGVVTPGVHEVVTPRKLLALTIQAYGHDGNFKERFDSKLEEIANAI